MTAFNERLCQACYQVSPQRVGELLDLGADPNFVDEEGMTPLHYVAQADFTALPTRDRAMLRDGRKKSGEAFASMTRKIVRLLLERGADAHVRDKHGKLALDYAICTRLRSFAYRRGGYVQDGAYRALVARPPKLRKQAECPTFVREM